MFSVHGSGHFQGYAKMMSCIGQEKAKDFTGPGLTGTFAVEWVKRYVSTFNSLSRLQVLTKSRVVVCGMISK